MAEVRKHVVSVPSALSALDDSADMKVQCWCCNCFKVSTVSEHRLETSR